MPLTTELVLTELTEMSNNHLKLSESLRDKTNDELNWKENPQSWSILECLEHLNRYGDYYIPQIEQVLVNSKSSPDFYFKNGLLGNYFAKMMLPGEKMKKMKTFKDKDPINSKLDSGVVDRFMGQQFLLLDQLKRCKHVSLNRERIPTSIASWLRLNLGDTLRVVIYHNERHLRQIENVLNKMRIPEKLSMV